MTSDLFFIAMECYVHPSIDYTRVPEMITAQRNFILSRVAAVTNSQRIYPPYIPTSDTTSSTSTLGPTSISGVNINIDTGMDDVMHSAARAMEIPGMTEAGWTMSDIIAMSSQGKETDRQKSVFKSDLLTVIRKCEEQQFCWPFRDPVDTTDVTDYLDIVHDPIDLSTIKKRITQDNYYKSRKMLHADLMRMVDNCLLYNDDHSTYAQCARQLEKFIQGLFPEIGSATSVIQK
jgi:histone acetyltransferase